AAIAAGMTPAAMEMLDEAIIRAINAGTGAGYPEGAGAVLLIELDGPRAEVEAQGERAAAICREHGALSVSVARDEIERALLEKAKEANEELLRACIALGGSVTGEHGMGLDKAKNLPMQYADADLNFMFRIRSVFDPERLMNPGKLLPTHPACGEGFRPQRPR